MTGRIEDTLKLHPIGVLLGPRQCGKTTLARWIAEDTPSTYFDLENPVDIRRLTAPMTVLEGLHGLVVIDEVQRRPEIFPLLRVLADRPGANTRFLLLGSASPHLVKGVSESLAGRIGFVDLSGFDLSEIGPENASRLWVRGGFPRSYLADADATSAAWRDSFVRTFLERDIPQLGITIPSETLGRFWRMVAHFHGQVWNAAQFARSIGASENTARRYLDILVGAFMVRALPPWVENLGKRQVKAPKVYLRDPGILHALLGLRDLSEIRGHPKLGASWEGFVLEQVLSLMETREAYFWATHAGAELDLMIPIRGKRFGFEIKYADAPGRTRSMLTAIEDLSLDHIWVIYPGKEEYTLHDRITAVPLEKLPELAGSLPI
jgi:predicted AAA+ superfamily ATPase